jgi:hypothetical protein
MSRAEPIKVQTNKQFCLDIKDAINFEINYILLCFGPNLVTNQTIDPSNNFIKRKVKIFKKIQKVFRKLIKISEN